MVGDEVIRHIRSLTIVQDLQVCAPVLEQLSSHHSVVYGDRLLQLRISLTTHGDHKMPEERFQLLKGKRFLRP